MHRSLKYMGSSALAVLALAGPLRADVTPQQVWDDLEAYLQSFGYTVSATESVSGNDLTLSDVAMSMDLPEDAGSIAFAMSKVTLADRGDGSVLMTFPPVMPITFAVSDPDAEDVEGRIDYEQSELEMIVSGSPGDLIYDYSADTLRMTLADLMVEGKAIPREVGRGTFTMIGVAGRSTVATDDMRVLAQTLSASGASYDISVNDPEGGGSGLFKGSLSDLTFAGSSVLPLEYDPTDFAAMVTAGFAFDGEYSYANGQAEFAVTEDGQATTGAISSATARGGASLNGEAMSYLVGNTGLSVNVTSAELPFPVTAQMAEMEFAITLPVAASDTPQDASLSVTLGGFTMSELLWNIIDPGAQLSRDPATIAFEIAARVTPYLSLFDQQAMAQLEESGEVPGELNSLTLTNLTVEAAGAKLTGEGDFTFDNADLETFDGMPKPKGTVNLQLSGANALIDKLILMGLLAEDDAMGARMMMSMFSVPAGDDLLNSSIEVNDQGHVMANGQRIR